MSDGILTIFLLSLTSYITLCFNEFLCFSVLCLMCIKPHDMHGKMWS